MGLKRSYLRVIDLNTGLYLQDNYKVTPRLTLSPGVRWDINPAVREENGLLNRFDVDSHSLMFPNSLDSYYKIGATTPKIVSLYEDVGVRFKSAAELNKSSQIFPSNKFDIGPRFGFAYKLFEGKKQTIVRGGYGIYFGPIPMRTLLAQFSSLAPFRATFSYNPNSAASSPDGISNYLLRNTPDIIAGSNSAKAVDINTPNAIARGASVLGMAPDMPDLKIHEWNLMIEKMLNVGTAFRLRYNGKHGVNSDQLDNINPTQTDYMWYTTTGLQLPTGAFSNVGRRPYDQTAYTDVRLLAKTGFINTETFTIEMERRFNKGLGFQVFYITP